MLTSYYGRPKDEVLDVVHRLSLADGLEVEGGDATLRAIELARQARVDLIDAMLAIDAAAHGEAVCTLERADCKKLPVDWVEP